MSFPRLEGYVFVSRIGAGSYSTVYKAYTKVGPRTVVAIKCVDKSRLKKTDNGIDNLLTEIKLLKSLRHPHIVHMRDFLWDDKCVYIVMEYCHGDLSTYIRQYGKLPEKIVRFFLQQLVLALKYLYEEGVAHMDLKPHNLLISKSSDSKLILKLADFGFACYLQGEGGPKDLRGSPLYMAPEMLAGARAGATADLWSVGVVMYECLFGQAPYRSRTLGELLDKLQNKQEIELPRDVPITAGCSDLLCRLLQHDPARRIQHDQLFQHEYLDLEHAPTEDNCRKGMELAHRAVAADRSGDTATALTLYRECLCYLVPLTQSEAVPARKNALTATLMRYMTRAEQIKTQLSGVPAAAASHATTRASGRGVDSSCSFTDPAESNLGLQHPKSAQGPAVSREEVTVYGEELPATPDTGEAPKSEDSKKWRKLLVGETQDGCAIQ